MLVRDNVFFADGRAINVVIAFCCVVLCAASTVIWNFSWNWFFRLAVVTSVAAILGVAIASFVFGLNAGVEIFTAYYLMQSIVLSLWLGLGPILPPRIDDCESTQPDPSAP